LAEVLPLPAQIAFMTVAVAYLFQTRNELNDVEDYALNVVSLYTT